ncbi:MAG: FAD-dependent oxidoreductase [Deltaproteobacteria bacterium]|nr:FAD-dependent oxidoreductase [Deltaproteobacteria bacterium]
MQFPHLFSPITINGMTVKNRVVMTAMHLNYTPDGEVTDQLIDFYSRRAKGGVGLIIVGGCPIDDQGSMRSMARLDDDRYIPGLRRLTQAVKQDGAKIAAQLYQAGRYVHSSMIGGKQAISASAVRSTFTGETPRALELDEIPMIQDRFFEAAARAKKSGFDAVEILGSAGYLISQFFSPVTNRRVDLYGGSFENRMRFGLEIAEKVRKAVGDDYPVIMRLAGNDFMEGGNTNQEARIFASELEKAGIDLFDITGGWHETRVPQITMSVPHQAYVYLAQGIKSVVSTPVLASNRINDPKIAEEILRIKAADLVTMARALIADPDLPKKAEEGRSDLIYHCVACNQGCFDSIFKDAPVSCLVNPRTGMEKETEIKQVTKAKKVLVIGGGLAGLKAAVTAAERGHQVILAEKSNQWGGQILLNKNIPGREEIVHAADDLLRNLQALHVRMMLNQEVDGSFIQKISPDAVVLATGAQPLAPPIHGLDDEKVVTAWDLLSGKAVADRRVAVVGGNAVGLETAMYLAHQGTISPKILYFLAANKAESWETLEQLINKGNKEVTVLEMDKKIGRDIGGSTRWTIFKELKRLGVNTVTEAKVTGVLADGLEFEKNGKREILSVDTIVIATGSESVNDLEGEISNLVREVHVIGDAKSPRNALEAIKEGFFTGFRI